MRHFTHEDEDKEREKIEIRGPQYSFIEPNQSPMNFISSGPIGIYTMRYNSYPTSPSGDTTSNINWWEGTWTGGNR